MDNNINKWWSYKFRIVWPNGEDPKLWIDIVLLDTVIRPLISELRGEISLWRFHRRATRDEEGHQFTFFCYSHDQTARIIHTKISSNEILAQLKKIGLLKKYLPPEEEGELIEANSDKDWPDEIRKSWPFFINGASDMFLELLTQLKATLGDINPSASISEVVSYYLNLHSELSKVWQKSGSHAFFHHIHALFGYVPVDAQAVLRIFAIT